MSRRQASVFIDMGGDIGAPAAAVEKSGREKAGDGQQQPGQRREDSAPRDQCATTSG